MGWFGITTDRDPNEAAYNGGQKHFRDVIQNESGEDLIYYMDPRVDFNTKSTLIVHPGEMAIFENNGRISDVFEEGRYVMENDNLPIIGRLRNMFTGGVSSFSCRVHYFRKADSAEIKWGTRSPIDIEDNIYNQEAKLGVRGAYKVYIDDPAVLLKRLLTSNTGITTQEDLNQYWRSEFISIITSKLTRALKSYQGSLIDAKNDPYGISQDMKPAIDDAISDYGVKLRKFVIEAIDFVDDFIERIRANKDIRRDKQLNALGNKDEVNILGQDWGRVQARDILSDLANNPGSGGEMAAAGAGLGMGLGAGSAFAGMAGQMFQPMQGQQQGQPAQGVTPPPVQLVQYFIYVNNQQVGPIDMNQLPQYVQSGQLTPDTLVWKQGMAQWAAAKTTELAQLFAQATPPPVPPVPPTVPPTT